MTVNPNRIVKLYKSTDESLTWKNNLWNLYDKSNKSDTNFFIDSKSTELKEALTVNSAVDLLMETDIPGFGSKGSQSYGTPIADIFDSVGINKIAGLAYEISDNIAHGSFNSTWMPWAQNVQAWTGTSGGIQISYTFNFSMGQYGLWNAREEVVKPILNLLAPTLPRKINGSTIEGPYPTTIGLIAQIIKDTKWKDISSSLTDSLGSIGSSISDIWSQKDANGIGGTITNGVQTAANAVSGTLELLGNLLEKVVNSSYESYTYTIKFGNLQEFRKMLITDSDVSFSNKVDQYGYPIFGSCTLTMIGVIPPALSFSTQKNGEKSVDRTSVKFGINL